MQSPLQIVYTGIARILAGDDEQVLKGAQLAYGAAFVLDLLFGEDDARDGVVVVEPAIDAKVVARVGDIKRYIHLYRFTETLLSIAPAQGGHGLQIGSCGWRNEGHEVVDGQVLLAQGNLHVAALFRVDAGGYVVPGIFF